MPSMLKKPLSLVKRLLRRSRYVNSLLTSTCRSARLMALVFLFVVAASLFVSTLLSSSAAAAAPPQAPERQQPIPRGEAPQQEREQAQPQPKPQDRQLQQQPQLQPEQSRPLILSQPMGNATASQQQQLQQQQQQQQQPAVSDFLRRVAEATREDPGGDQIGALRSKLAVLNRLAVAGTGSLTDRAKACAGAQPPLALRYVQNFAYVHNEPDLCAGQLLLLTAVHSNAKNFNRRATIRRTWGSLRYVGASRLQLVFFLGRPETDAQQTEIDAESRRFRDIVQVDFREHYRNMSLKHLSIYEWTIVYCSATQFLVKVDDDTFTDVVHLVAFLQHSPPTGFYCSNTRGAKPQRLKRGPKAKWAVSRSEFLSNRYPAYCEGFGYVVKTAHLSDMYLCSFFSKFFWIDDVYVTGVLAAAAKVPLSGFWAGHGYTGQLPSLASEKILDYIFLVADHNEFLEVVWHRLWRSVLQYSLDMTL